jgi:hypothetical protein
LSGSGWRCFLTSCWISPVHRKTIAAYPLARLHLGADSWIAWGSRNGWPGWNNDWWLQLAVLLLFLAMYAIGGGGHLSWKVLGLQLITLAPCVGY